MVTGNASRAGPARELLHVVTGLASWVAFVLLWSWEAGAHLPADWPVTIATVVGILAAYGTLALVWVRWNRRIYRRRHRRISPMLQAVATDRDHLGRPVVLPDGLRLVGHDVVISLTGTAGAEVKHYRRRPVPEAARISA